MNPAGGIVEPGSERSSVCANVALIRRPRTPVIMSFEEHGEHELCGIDSNVVGLAELTQATG